MGAWVSNSCVFFPGSKGPETIHFHGVLGGLFFIQSFLLSSLFDFFFFHPPSLFMIPRALDLHVVSYNSNIPREMQLNTFF
jgi:hypothetical protein